jgi:hypothetical protein
MLARSAFAPRKRNSHKADDARRFPSHLAWLRKRPCLLEGRHGHACEGRMEAAHVDHAGGKGTGIKVADYHAVPLCTEAHRLLHAHGRLTWEKAFRVDLIEAAKEYAKASPHRFQWEQPNG